MRAAWCLMAALVASACAEKDPPKTDEPAAKAAVDGEFCEEHGVLEAVCTKCNPKLAAVFQAKGDWCDQHGFPESFCPICHPEAGGRPAQDVAGAGDGAPPHGTKVRFKTREAAGLAGIEVAKAEERPGGARLEAVAVIAYDATRRAEVNARASGVVRSLKVDVGAKVKIRTPLATIDSAQVGADRSRLAAADARVENAEITYKREQDLHAKGVSSEKDMLAAKQALEEARAERRAAAAALGVVGGGKSGSGYTLTAPIAGTVIRRTATIGHMVEVDEALFEIVDTSAMWAEVDVPEAQLPHVASGQAVTVTIDGVDTRFAGVLDYIAPEVDPTTRTAKARVALKNPDGVLRANMFARAEIALGGAKPTVMVPSAAVQRAKGVALVFVRIAPDEFEARRVKTGLVEGELVEIVEGIKRGEEVATKGSFLLKTETLKGSIGAGCCDVE
ncbi:MAG: efflux RND transporter periplasmic adaptor subunit [Kofleriaceae bacterium]|nr:MAG: efflux RND transporter periplasmic adaptor subunit [Kofleriaceae bacterium]MBZ0233068.1 efflux RND transporter periplasmic adaptor subunit [Kofleriaceae bacterium]